MKWQTRRIGPLAVALVLLAASKTAEACVESHAVVEGGNVIAQQSTGARFRITDSASDSEPDLSCDGTKVVFVPTLGSQSSEIWIANTSEPHRPEPLTTSPITISNRKFAQVFSPKFSPAQDRVYFLIPFAATTQAIVVADLVTRKFQLITAALNFRVVPAGKYGGDLIAQIRKAKLAPGYYEWYWLLSPDGKELGVVGQSERDADLFLDEQRDGAGGR